jgi:pSer/pThr/pTyr-binding forkhead associated (FHA) protein
MNMFKAFEARIAQAFGESMQGAPMPFSFRRLAKSAAREMEQETYIADGVDTAPALFTVLVSEDDDIFMRPLYATLTEEIASFVEAEAAAKGYVFVGKPLARFMVDKGMRGGKFAVFADNVDAATLSKLRLEESVYLSSIAVGNDEDRYVMPHAPKTPEGLPAQDADGHPLDEKADLLTRDVDPVPVAADVLAEAFPIMEGGSEEDSMAGLTILPTDYDDGVNKLADPLSSDEQVNQPLSESLPDPIADADSPAASPEDDPSPVDTPAAEDPAETMLSQPTTPAEPARRSSDVCQLVDRATGVAYFAHAPSTRIGRGRQQTGIVLDDANVSRSHAELLFDGDYWRIHDLGSTNGTMVNGVDIETQVLQPGDVITIGLMSFEFRVTA